MLSSKQLARNRKGGLARAAQLGTEGRRDLGRKGGLLGGRPTTEVALEKALLELQQAQAMSKPGRPRSR